MDGNRISISNVPEQEITPANKQVLKVAVKNSYVIQGGGSPYSGPYEITPSSEEQQIHAAGQYLEQDLVVKAIPNNYGLITYNGSIITVS